MPLKVAALVVAAISLFVAGVLAQRDRGQFPSSRDVTILVTAHPHDSSSRFQADRLKPEDFSVTEDEKPQQIVSVRSARDVPPVVAVLIQDDLVMQVNNEIRGIKEFIKALPYNSRVMVGYITVGSLRIRQDFTTDREGAAETLRIVVSSSSGSAFSIYEEVIDALRRFDSQPAGRRMVLLISDGLDLSRGISDASPGMSMDLNRAIDEAQRRGIAVFGMYAPSIGLTRISHIGMNFGQGSLSRMADKTGGDAFYDGSGFVSFDPYFKELNDLLGRQWLITYRTTNLERGVRKIQVKTDYDLKLLHQTGYRLRREDIDRP
jgi:VWFA-related protein